MANFGRDIAEGFIYCWTQDAWCTSMQKGFQDGNEVTRDDSRRGKQRNAQRLTIFGSKSTREAKGHNSATVIHQGSGI
jgi:hypothetical protein